MPEMFSRRTLLRGSATLGAAALISQGFAGARAARFDGQRDPYRSDPPSPISLGMASYTFRKFDRAHLLDFMKQLRMSNLNLKEMHLPMGPVDEVKKAADEYRAHGMNLTAVGTVTFAEDDEADIRSKFDYARAAGVGVIVAAPTREVLPRLEKFVREYDVRIAVHNHGPEDKQFPSPLDVLAAVKNLDRRIGCCIDVGHCMRAGIDPVQAIHSVGPRIYDIHMKDLANSTLKESQVAVGKGVMPVRGIFQALIETKYKGYVDLEYEIHEDDPLPGVMESVTYMRGVLAGMGYRGQQA